MLIPLKVTTDYTLLSSLITIDKLIPLLKEHNVPSCGICDINLQGAYSFYKECTLNGIKPLIGLEITITDLSLYLYAKNYEGYKGLLSINYTSQERDLSLIDLIKFKDNITIVLPYKSKSLAKELKDYDLYISYENEHEQKNILVNGYKAIYMPDIKMIENDDSVYLSYLDLIKNGKTVKDIEEKDNVSLKDLLLSVSSSDETTNTFIDNINIKFPEKPNYLPKYITDKDPYTLLTTICLKGLNKRLSNNVPTKYKERLNYELSIIKQMNFVDYFLVVYDYVLYAKKNDISVGPGRGSAAGSLVSYCLGITDIDPLKYNLLFERFLNPNRVTMPDIDIDFEDEKRYQVIDYVKEKYTKEKVGLIITYGTLQTKQVLRDVARILEIDEATISSLSKLIDGDLSLVDNYKNKEVKKILEGNKLLQKCYKISNKLYGLKKHTSLHAAGVVISSEALKDIVPVVKENDDLVVGLTMNELEANGLLKMDFLALKNLSTIKDIINLINKDEKKVDFNYISLDDAKTFRLLQSGKTKGIFQFETPGMQNLLTKIKPTCFEDLIAAVALFRPGPMDNIDLYIKNKNNPERIKYPHESLKNILKETYGIIIYQEQIMQILQLMAGYSFAEADDIRRAMSKKKEEIILKEKDNFINKSVQNGYTKEISESIYNLILKFANYGFNKAHSVSYAIIGYKMAYLKANFPDKFIISNLNIFGKAQIKSKEYLSEALSYHLKVHKPSINKSANVFVANGINILLPFNQIVGISEEFAKVIYDERIKNGEYKSVFDFVRRIPEKFVTENNLKKLIYGEVFNEFGYNQKTLYENIDNIINYASLASGLDNSDVSEPYLIISKNYSENELRLIEKETFGFYVSNHPSAKYQDNVVKAEKIMNYFDKRVNMILCIEQIRTFKTKKDENMASILASDETGEIELVIFPRNIDLINNLIEGDIVLASGTVGRRFSDYQLIINTIKKKVEKNIDDNIS